MSGQNTIAAMGKGPNGAAWVGIDGTSTGPGIALYSADPGMDPSLKMEIEIPGTINLVDLVHDNTAGIYILGTYDGAFLLNEMVPVGTARGFIAYITTGGVAWAHPLPQELTPTAITLRTDGSGAVLSGWAALPLEFDQGSVALMPNNTDGIVVEYDVSGSFGQAATVGTAGHEKILDIAPIGDEYAITGSIGLTGAQRATIGTIGANAFAAKNLVIAGQPVTGYSEGTGLAIGANNQIIVTGVASGSLTIAGEMRPAIGDQDIFVASFPPTLAASNFVERFGAPAKEQFSPSLHAHTGPTEIVLSATCNGPVAFRNHVITAPGPRMCFAELDANGIAQWAKALGTNTKTPSYGVITNTHIFAGGTFTGNINCGLIMPIMSEPPGAFNNSYVATFTRQ